jgi:hypothetical protein
MLATLPADSAEGLYQEADDSSPMTWRYGYIIACKHWFYATCSTLDNNNVLDIIINANEDLLALIQNPSCIINHIYLMTHELIDSRALRMQEIKSIYQSDLESSSNITIEVEDGHLLVLSKDGSSMHKNRIYFCSSLNLNG